MLHSTSGTLCSANHQWLWSSAFFAAAPLSVVGVLAYSASGFWPHPVRTIAAGISRQPISC
jgi:hypothetical protein